MYGASCTKWQKSIALILLYVRQRTHPDSRGRLTKDWLPKKDKRNVDAAAAAKEGKSANINEINPKCKHVAHSDKALQNCTN